MLPYVFYGLVRGEEEERETTRVGLKGLSGKSGWYTGAERAAASVHHHNVVLPVDLVTMHSSGSAGSSQPSLTLMTGLPAGNAFRSVQTMYRA